MSDVIAHFSEKRVGGNRRPRHLRDKCATSTPTCLYRSSTASFHLVYVNYFWMHFVYYQSIIPIKRVIAQLFNYILETKELCILITITLKQTDAHQPNSTSFSFIIVCYVNYCCNSKVVLNHIYVHIHIRIKFHQHICIASTKLIFNTHFFIHKYSTFTVSNYNNSFCRYCAYQ